MTQIQSIIKNLEDWSGNKIIPKDKGFYHLAFFLEPRINGFNNPFSFQIPNDVYEWWEQVEYAELFKDIDYGQWGLQIISERDSLTMTKECLEERPSDFVEKDVIIARFIGDSELLVINCEKENFGQVIVTNPIDIRSDWYMVSTSFSEFLEKYLESEGDKFWE